MRAARTLLALLTLLLAGMAGCAQKPDADGGAPTMQASGGGPGDAHGLWNYTTPHPGGLLHAKDYTGSLTADEVSGLEGGVPFGFAPPPLPTCCFFDWAEATDLMAIDQLVALRVTVNWTNTPTDRAGLDAAACIPWNCEEFASGPDESLSEGAHSDTLTLITQGRQDFLDDVGAYLLGVRYTNAYVTTGLPYTIHVEVAPVGDGLSLQEPYMVHVAPNATVFAELVGPFSEEVGAGIMAYGPDDRPRAWIEVEGRHGDRRSLTLPAGTHVLVPFDYDGGFIRLATDRKPEMTTAHRLKVENGQTDLAEVTDPQAHSGSLDYAAPPASMGDFPFFLYSDGAAAQSLLGVTDVPGTNITMASSTGLVAAVQLSRLSARHADLIGNVCVTCNSIANWQPANYLDDDGTYQVKWSSSGGTGKFVMFTQRYVR